MVVSHNLSSEHPHPGISSPSQPQHLRSALCSALSLETASGSCPEKCHKRDCIAIVIVTSAALITLPLQHSMMLCSDRSLTLQSSINIISHHLIISQHQITILPSSSLSINHQPSIIISITTMAITTMADPLPAPHVAAARCDARSPRDPPG